MNAIHNTIPIEYIPIELSVKTNGQEEF